VDKSKGLGVSVKGWFIFWWFIFFGFGVGGFPAVPLTACQGQAVVFFAKQKISTVKYDP
jgi:hypothetical protein